MMRVSVVLAIAGLVPAGCSSPAPAPSDAGTGAPTTEPAATVAPAARAATAAPRPFLLYTKISTGTMTPGSVACYQQGAYGRDFVETAPVEIRVRGTVSARGRLSAPNTQNGYCEWFARFDRPDETPVPELDPSITAEDVRVVVHGRDLGHPSWYRPGERRMNVVLTDEQIPQVYGSAGSTS